MWQCKCVISIGVFLFCLIPIRLRGRSIYRVRLHLVPSSRSSNIRHRSNTEHCRVAKGLVDIQSLKKSIWRFLLISRRFLKLLTVAASISSCDRLFQRLITRWEKKWRRQSQRQRFSPVSPKPVSPKPDSPKPVSPKPDSPNLGKGHSTCSCSCFIEKYRTLYHSSITFVVRTFRYCNSEPSQHS